MIYQLIIYYGALINGKVVYSNKTELVDATILPTQLDEKIFKDMLVMQIEQDGLNVKDFEFSYLTKEQYESRDKNERQIELTIKGD